MDEFDFATEMVYGKKHMCKLNYDKNKYKFVDLVTQLFDIELNELHNIIPNLFSKPSLILEF